MAKKMNSSIFINKILKPELFANQIIEFLFDNNEIIEINLLGKINSEDKKVLKGINKTSFFRKLIFRDYNFKLGFIEFKSLQDILNNYFQQDWGLIINENQKGYFSYTMNVFYIDCLNEEDKKNKLHLFDSFIENNIIDKFEIIEDDYIDPYYENKKSHSI